MKSACTSLVIGSVLFLSACSGNSVFNRPDPGQILVRQCLIETGTPGAYSSQSGVDVPVVTPIAKYDGTRRGAASVNACIRAKVADGAVTTRKVSWRKPRTYTYGVPAGAGEVDGFGNMCPKHASVLYGGVTYCVGN